MFKENNEEKWKRWINNSTYVHHKKNIKKGNNLFDRWNYFFKDHPQNNYYRHIKVDRKEWKKDMLDEKPTNLKITEKIRWKLFSILIFSSKFVCERIENFEFVFIWSVDFYTLEILFLNVGKSFQETEIFQFHCKCHFHFDVIIKLV